MIDKLFQQAIVKADRERVHTKESFWASETETPAWDIWHSFMGIEPTNPKDSFSLWRMECGKIAEEGIVKYIKYSMLIGKDFSETVVWDEDRKQHYFKVERGGVQVSGAIDGIINNGMAVFEIKSYYGDYAGRDYANGKPKMNYLKQLAVYMDVMNVDTGYLLMVPMPAGEFYCFTLRREGGMYVCGDISFSLDDVYKRWNTIYNEFVLPKKCPDAFYDGVRYKYDINTLDWSKVSNSAITEARQGRKVVGSWEILYSSWKDKWIQAQGTELGYTLEEVERIKFLTTGFSSKKK